MSTSVLSCKAEWRRSWIAEWENTTLFGKRTLNSIRLYSRRIFKFKHLKKSWKSKRRNWKPRRRRKNLSNNFLVLKLACSNSVRNITRCLELRLYWSWKRKWMWWKQCISITIRKRRANILSCMVASSMRRMNYRRSSNRKWRVVNYESRSWMRLCWENKKWINLTTVIKNIRSLIEFQSTS